MHKLVYSAGYSVNDYIKHELFTIWAYCDSNNIAKIKKIIKETINEASKKEITIQDLKTAVRFYNIRTLMANDSIANLAYYTASELFFENRYTPLTTYEHLSQSIKPEEIKQYLASFLSIDTALVAIAKNMGVDD